MCNSGFLHVNMFPCSLPVPMHQKSLNSDKYSDWGVSPPSPARCTKTAVPLGIDPPTSWPYFVPMPPKQDKPKRRIPPPPPPPKTYRRRNRMVIPGTVSFCMLDVSGHQPDRPVACAIWVNMEDQTRCVKKDLSANFEQWDATDFDI